MSIKLIAEIGSNWEGDVELGKKHIEEAKKSGASFVKFQMWRAKDLYDSTHPQWNSIKKSELTLESMHELKKYSDKIGIDIFCSVFYPECIDFLESLNISMYKIASRTSRLVDKYSLETLKRVAETGKKTFISTGEGADKEIIKKIFSNNSDLFTYCVSNYPTKDNEISWDEIMNYSFFSDHTVGITIPIVFAVLKKSRNEDDIYIEKHTRFNDSSGPDSSFAITYEDLANLSSHIKRLEKLDL